eukprot:5012224-Amphidinium_carterae.7
MGGGFATMSKHMRKHKTQQKKQLCAITAEMRAHGRELCKQRQTCSAHERNHMKSLLCHSDAVVDSIIRDRRGLAAISGCKWYGLPHTCRHMCANLLARHPHMTEAEFSRSGLTKKALYDAWQKRHGTVLPSPKSRVSGATSSCFREGFCHCKPRHRGLRALRDGIIKILRTESRNKLARQDLADGHLGLAFFSEADAGRDCVFAHIALQYFKPFRPTFALLSHYPDDCATNHCAVHELLCAGHGAFSLKLRLEERTQHTDLPCLRTLVELCSDLASRTQWSCCLFRLSDHDSPCALPPAAIRVRVHGSIHQLWSCEHEDVDEAFLDVLRSGVFTRGPGAVVEAESEEAEAEDEGGIDDTDLVEAEAEHTRRHNKDTEDNADPHDEFVAGFLQLLQHANEVASARTPSSSSSSTSSSSSSGHDVADKHGAHNCSSDSSSSSSSSSIGSSKHETPKPKQRKSIATGGTRQHHEGLPVYSLEGTTTGAVIRYKPQSEDLYCNCAVHRSCTRTRTAKAGKKQRQGRPLGELAAWSLAASSLATKEEHQKHMPEHASRQAARLALQQNEDYAEWTCLERPQRAGEESEPE